MNSVPKEVSLFFREGDDAKMLGNLHAMRRVLLTGDLTEASFQRLRLELIKLELQEKAPITILLESIGGDVVASLQFQDTISMLKSPIDILAIGNCASTAVDVMQMCRKRYMLPNARLLVHYVRHTQRWICDDPAQMEVDLEHFRKGTAEMREQRLALYGRTGKTRKKITEMFRYGEVHEAYFSATQAIKLGLADKIMKDFKLL